MLAALAISGCAASASVAGSARPAEPPPVQREMRGAWVATVDNIDWPSKRTLSTAQQQQEFIRILDRAQQLRLNTIIFQVRPACDALYESKLEPWSEYLTGQQGRPPQPYWDPLAFAVEESHKRGLELHAWFNPYRAKHPTAVAPLAASHLANTKPHLVRTYGKHLWLDPGDPAVRKHTRDVVMDVVRRYDVDGVHIDDYFYPYKEKDAAGQTIPFPDAVSFKAYQSRGGKLEVDDWRRWSVDELVEDVFKSIKREKSWVKFGISPFGIWRPGNPAQIKGFDSYAEIYGDARKWIHEGWVDYLTPQLYWKIDPPAQSYPVLLKWWVEQNRKGRIITAGNYTGRILDGSWQPEEVLNQIRVTREQPGTAGNVHFSFKVLARPNGIGEMLAKGLYAEQALPPEMPWVDKDAPGRPQLELKNTVGEGTMARWSAAEGEEPWLWVVQARGRAGRWTTRIVPASVTRDPLVALGAEPADTIAVSAVDRAGNQSKPAVLEVR